MSFEVAAEAYDRFMGRYSNRLAGPFADLAGIEIGWRVLDVGCGPGALLGELVRRVGSDRVAGVDPVEGFVAAALDRHPGTLVRQAAAERLPFDDNSFDAVLAQLAVHFMADPVVGLAEMNRVAVNAGIVAACVWDYHEGGGPLSTFWTAAIGLDSDAPGETELPGTGRGDLGVLFRSPSVETNSATGRSRSKRRLGQPPAKQSDSQARATLNRFECRTFGEPWSGEAQRNARSASNCPTKSPPQRCRRSGFGSTTTSWSAWLSGVAASKISMLR